MTDKKLQAAPVTRLLVTSALTALLLVGCSGGGADTAPKAASSETAQQSAPAAAAAPAQEARTHKGDPVAGKVVYDNYCRFCHGNEGYGDGPIGTAITPHPANFVEDAERMAKTDEELYRSITKGIERQIGGEEMVMPRWQEILSDQERWDVLAYIRELHRKGNESK